MQRFDINIKYK